MNWDILGHEWAIKLLKEHVANQTFRHAYLFTGPQGIGRRTLALRFAQALNCPQPMAPGEPCQRCRTCTHIEKMQHPDLVVVQSEYQGANLKIDQVREIQTRLALAPYEARYRVAIFLRFEEATLSASNALLKTLEEPPAHVVLILTAESGESLPPTIVSRCELLRLRPLKIETVEQGLQDRWGIPPEGAYLLAHLSSGRIGYAVALHNSPERLDRRTTLLDAQHKLLSSTRVERFAYAESLSKDKDELLQALGVWQSLWRDVFLQASKSNAPLANLDRSEEIKALADRLGAGVAAQMVTNLQRTIGLLEKNVNSRLATEAWMLELPRL
jgi:DNA polymerase III subunit delta'